ncbi:MAG: L-lactate dehydrogenase [Clostridia bacterium]|nr:L-lactate dehydrogenase [Clostridia bacterium]
MSKIVIIGAGHVGSHCALSLSLLGVCGEIVLLDIDRRKAEAQARDAADAAALLPHAVRIRDGWYDECRTADIVVLAAGAPRVPERNARGETVAPSRLALLEETMGMLRDVAPQLARSGFDGVAVSISNPCDVIAQCLQARLGLPAARVFGTGTGLDTARLRARLAEASGCSCAAVSCLVMGEHGDSQVAPRSQARIQGKPPEPDLFAAAAQAARMGGASIIGGKGATEFGIGLVLAEIARAVLRDEKRALPVSALLEGQFGQRDVYAGVPALIGRSGVEAICRPTLTPDELLGFARSCEIIRRHARRAEAL